MTVFEVLPLWLPKDSILSTISKPAVTLPKTTCFRSNHGVSTVQIKNCEPLVPGPAFAMLKMPFPSCLSLKFSSCCEERRCKDSQRQSKRQERFTRTLYATHIKLSPINGFATGSVAVGKVATAKLQNKVSLHQHNITRDRRHIWLSQSAKQDASHLPLAHELSNCETR